MHLEDRLALVRDQRGQAGAVASEGFQQALSDLADLADPSAIAPILLLLSDDADSEATNRSLLLAAEAYDDAAYVGGLLRALPTVNRLAPNWAEVLVLRALKKEQKRLLLARQVVGAERVQKDAINGVCGRILKKDPSHIAKAAAVVFASQT